MKYSTNYKGRVRTKLKNYVLLLTVLMLFRSASAQLCQGSLGDPIVNITFGSGNNPGPSLSAATTNYQFKYDDCPDDGYYTVRNRTDNCFSGWHSLNADHTGNANGYFMLVNASYQPSAFYIDTVDLQCNNTVYEFAAWVINMNRPYECSGSPIQPNLTFNIERTDGTVIQSYNSGDIAPQTSVTWRQYGFFFSTPTDVNRVVLRITNNAQGGCGNDLALDDITFRPCGPMLNASIDGNGQLKEFCEGEATPQSFSCNVSPGYSNPHFQWQQNINGAGWTDIAGANDVTMSLDFSAATAAGVYQYRLSVSQTENISKPVCRVASNILTVRINASPAKTIAVNAPLCESGGILLSASGGEQYTWTGPNGFSATGPTANIDNAQISQSGNYSLEVVTAAGCSRKDTIAVKVNPRPVASVGAETVFMCEGRSTNLSATGGDAYLWKPFVGLSSSSAANPVASPTDSVLYSVIVSNSFSCTDTAYVQVNVSKKPIADAGSDQHILEGQPAQLSGSISGTNVSYGWSPAEYMDNANSLDPVINPPADKVYTLQVVSHDGCGTAVDSVKVNVYKGIYVPNAFSPNGDGLNDTWKVPALHVFINYEILVFNRYGQVVYTSKSNAKPWDGSFGGKQQPSGVYPYIITIKDLPLQLKGWVTIVR